MEETYCETISVIVDDVPPVITCPDAITVECGTSSDPVITGYAGASDNIPNLIIISYFRRHSFVGLPGGGGTNLDGY